MKLEVKVIYRDDKIEKFESNDWPNINGWITIYKENLERINIPSEAIKRIETKIINKKI